MLNVTLLMVAQKKTQALILDRSQSGKDRLHLLKGKILQITNTVLLGYGDRVKPLLVVSGYRLYVITHPDPVTFRIVFNNSDSFSKLGISMIHVPFVYIADEINIDLIAVFYRKLA